VALGKNPGFLGGGREELRDRGKRIVGRKDCESCFGPMVGEIKFWAFRVPRGG